MILNLFGNEVMMMDIKMLLGPILLILDGSRTNFYQGLLLTILLALGSFIGLWMCFFGKTFFFGIGILILFITCVLWLTIGFFAFFIGV